MKYIFRICLIALLYTGCTKGDEPSRQEDTLLKIDNFVFNTRTSKDLKSHPIGIDTLSSSYTLQGFGVFSGKSRLVKFGGGGTYQGIPVIEISGWDDFGDTYVAKDTSGNIIELYRKKFGTSAIVSSNPITVFASKKLLQGDEWNSATAWEQGRNTLYFTFQTKVLGTNATTSNGIGGCIELEYSAPDFKDTILFKPGKGPVEVRSWRAHLYENDQPGTGGYR